MLPARLWALTPPPQKSLHKTGLNCTVLRRMVMDFSPPLPLSTKRMIQAFQGVPPAHFAAVHRTSTGRSRGRAPPTFRLPPCLRSSGESARRCSSPHHRGATGEEGAPAYRQRADRHAPHNAHPTGRDGTGGRTSCMTVGTLFYAAQIAFQPHPQPALKMTMDCVFRLRLPLTFQKLSEWSELSEPTLETQCQQGFQRFRHFLVLGVGSDMPCRNRALLPHC